MDSPNAHARAPLSPSIPYAPNDATAVEKMDARCNLCGSDQRQLLFEGIDRQLGHSGQFPIVKCKQCGLIYQSPRPVDIGPFYQGGYLSHDEMAPTSPAAQPLLYRLGLKKGSHVPGRAGLYYEVFKQVAPAGGALLDVGCANGAFIAAMDRLGYDVHGVETDAAAAAQANEALRHLKRKPVVNATLEQAGFSAGSFDIITLWHAIEHVDDPLSTLREVRRLLKPGGICVIQTPKAECIESRIFGVYWAGWECPRHLWLFTANTLTALSQKAGFNRIQALNGTSYGIFSLSLKFWLEAKTSPAISNWVFNQLSKPLPDRALYWLFQPADALGLGSQLTLCLTK